MLAQDAAQAAANIVFPPASDPTAHSLRIEVSPSIAGSLFSALDYLTSYPYGCTEQTMSSYLPNVIVAETLGRLKVGGRVDEADLRAKMQAGLERLKDYQHDDGGWGWWKEDESRVYMTAYVVSGIGHGLRSSCRSPTSNARCSTEARQYLTRQLDQHPRMRPGIARRRGLCSCRGRRHQSAEMRLTHNGRAEKISSPEALAMTGLAMLQTQDARAPISQRCSCPRPTHQGDLVLWKGSYVPLLDADYDNDAEATAYAMRLLARVDPNNPLLAGAAQWLMLARNGGVWWDSTEQTAMVLFGLVDYLAASHELESDFTADVLVNGHSAGQRHFTPADA